MGLFFLFYKRGAGCMKIAELGRGIKNKVSEHSPEILLGMGIAGMLSSTVMAVKATPKAMRLIEEEKKHNEDLSKVDILKIAWRPYIPAAISFTASAACLVGAQSVNAKRNAVLATAYKISEYTLTEYRDKVVEVIGEQKEKEIVDAVSRDRIKKDPLVTQEVIITGKGDTLCYDAISGRYFKSDIDKMQKIENLLNKRMMTSMYCSLNEFYSELGLTSTDVGDELGWNIEEGLIDLYFSSQLSEEGQPCVVVNYMTPPKYGYSKLS